MRSRLYASRRHTVNNAARRHASSFASHALRSQQTTVRVALGMTSNPITAVKLLSPGVSDLYRSAICFLFVNAVCPTRRQYNFSKLDSNHSYTFLPVLVFLQSRQQIPNKHHKYTFYFSHFPYSHITLTGNAADYDMTPTNRANQTPSISTDSSHDAIKDLSQCYYSLCLN